MAENKWISGKINPTYGIYNLARARLVDECVIKQTNYDPRIQETKQLYWSEVPALWSSLEL